MSSKGQVVIPEPARRQLGLETGDQFVVVAEDDVLVLKRIRAPDTSEFRSGTMQAGVAAAAVSAERELPPLGDIIRRIVEAVSPERILLFGSAARGQVGVGSDLDLLVVVPNGTHRRHATQRVHEAMAGTGIPVDVVVATEDDIDQYGQDPGMIYQRALQEGREVYAV